MQETLVQFLGGEDLLEKGYAIHSSIRRLPCGLAGKESTCNAGDLGSIPGLGRSSGEGKSISGFWPGEFHGLYSPTFTGIKLENMRHYFLEDLNGHK